MLKKLIGTIVILVMLLGTIGLAACDESLVGYKEERKAAIEAYAEERKNNYSEDNWTAVCGIVDTGKQAVYEAENKTDVDTAVREATEGIDKVETNFKLTISINATKFKQNDDIVFELELKNQTDESHNIAYFFLITPHVPSASYVPDREMPEHPYFLIFESGETISRMSNIGGYFERGTHQVKYTASFYLDWEAEGQKLIEVWSNSIQISII